MAVNKKISELTELAEGPALGDLLALVDISDTTDAASGTTKKNTAQYALGAQVNAQTGTTYTYLTTDFRKLVTHTSGSAIAGTLPQAGVSFPAGWYMLVQNRGAGALTITPTTSTIDGAASIVLNQNEGAIIVSDGTNYFTLRGKATGAAGVGDVVGPASATDNAVARFDSTTGKLIQNSAVTVDDNGAITIPEIAAPSTPAAGNVAVYAKSDGKIYIKDDAGAETDLTASGSSGYSTVQDEGSSLTQRSTLNFTGAGVNVTDDGSKTVVNVPTPGGALTDPLGTIMQWQANRTAGATDATFGVDGLGTSGSSGDGSDSTAMMNSWTSTTTLNADAGVGPNAYDMCQSRYLPIFYVKFKTGATVTEFRMWVGLTSNGTTQMASDTPASHYVMFRWSTTAADTNWKAVSDNGSGTPTVTDTGVAFAASTHYNMKIDCSDPASIKFYIDGVLVATHTTTLPTTSQNLGFHCKVRNTGSTNAKRVDMARMVLSLP